MTFTPHPGFATPPKYWSGTSCRAHYSAVVSAPDKHIVSSEIRIGGVLVYDSDVPMPAPSKPPPYRLADSPIIMFDSTHFNNATSVKIEMTVTTDLQSYVHSYQTNTFNASNAWAACHSPNCPTVHEPNGAAIVEQYLEDSKIPVYSHFDDDWTGDDFLDTMPFGSLLYISTHGSNTAFQADKLPIDWINSFHINTARQQQMGGGVPPYNSSGKPPIAFFHILACYTGNTSSFIETLFPKTNAYNSNVAENQAVLAYKKAIIVGQTTLITQIVSQGLAQGKTVNKVREDLANADVYYYPCGGPNNCSTQGCNHETEDLTTGHISIFGDEQTRIKGNVYTRTDSSAPNGWYRVVTNFND